jgi:hypothetical protein
MAYSPERRAAVIARMLPPNSVSLTRLAKEEGIALGTLARWRDDARRQGQMLPAADRGPEGWSSAIGKDALTFMGAGLATWGALNLTRRCPALVVATFAFMFARPHISLIMMVALALALIFASRVGRIRKLALLLVTLLSAAVTLPFVVQFIGLGDAISLTDIEQYAEERQGYNLEGGSSVDITQMLVPMRLLTYLYRPFFFDAGGLMGLIVSFENLFIAIVTLSALGPALVGRTSRISKFSVIFFAIFFIYDSACPYEHEHKSRHCNSAEVDVPADAACPRDVVPLQKSA